MMMNEREYRELETALETALNILRRSNCDMRVSEIRLRADLEALRADLLKMMMRRKEERDGSTAIPFPEQRAG
jgi:hypothetical protein